LNAPVSCGIAYGNQLSGLERQVIVMAAQKNYIPEELDKMRVALDQFHASGRLIIDVIEKRAAYIKEAGRTFRAKRPVQQARFSITPSDFEFCPHCSGSFSFRKLGRTFICPWCKKDVRTSIRMA
jgi:hypothetical protein